jgi:hypothetical protein
VIVLSFLYWQGDAHAQRAVNAADIYVAANGSDRNNGSADAPLATLERAKRAVQNLRRSKRNAPIIVMLRQGTYFLSEPLKFGSEDSGSPEAPVIYQAAPGEKVIISGGRQITGWRNVGGRWTVSLDPGRFQYFEQLFVNDQRRYRPRTTKNGFLYNEGPVYVDSPSENCRKPAEKVGGYECFDRFRFKGNDLQPNYANMNDVEIDNFEKWCMSKLRLKSVDMSQHIAYLTGPTIQNVENAGFLPGHRYLVENVKEALREPGEWYLDRGTSPWQLTYLPKPGESPEKDVVIVPQLAQFIQAENLSYVTFKGIHFEHDNWVIPPEGHPALQSEPWVPGALSFTNSNHIVFDGCSIAHTGGWGLEFLGPSHDNQVLNSVLWDLGVGGVKVGVYHQPEDTDENVAHSTLVQNNLIAAGGRILPAGIGTGVWIGHSPANTVTHNEIYDFYGGGIGVCVPTPRGCDVTHDNVVSYNLVYQQGQGVLSDFGGIYLATFKTTGNQVLNNVVHDVVHNYQDPDGYGGHGIYLDNVTSNVLVKNNLIYRTSQGAIFNNKGANNTWTNNILAFDHTAMIQKGGGKALAMRRRQREENAPFGGRRRGRRRQRPDNLPEAGREAGGRPPRQEADPDKPAFIFTHNIVVLDRGSVQKTPAPWLCQRPDNDETVPCTERFFFDYNLYWHYTGAHPTFAVSRPENPREADQLSFQDWQRLGEDVHSLIADPRFANPKYPADDFTLLPGSPAQKIGFVPFDPKQAGLTTRLPRPPAQPPAFPLQLLNPADF